jgi:hypothetical protein
MVTRELENQIELVLKNLARGQQIIAQSKIVVEDLETMTILSIEACAASVEKQKRRLRVKKTD